MKHFRFSLVFVLLISIAVPGKKSLATDTLLQAAMLQPDSAKLNYIIKAIAKHYRSQPDAALRWIDQVEKLSFELADPDARSQAYRFAGAIFKNKGEFAKALSFHLKSLKINDSLKNKPAMATNYNDIGIVYKNLGDYPMALEAYKKANELVTELDMKKGIVMTLNNLGTIYEALNQLEDALKYYNRAFAKATEFNFYEGISVSLNNIGEYYANKNQYREAIPYFREAIQIDQKTGDKMGSALTQLNLAAMFIHLKQWDSAAFHFESVKHFEDQYKSFDLRVKLYNGLTRLYEEQGNYRKALEMFREARIAEDSVFNQEKARQLAEMQTRFENMQKSFEIEQLKSDNLLKEVKLKQQKAVQLSLVLILVFGATLSYVLVRRQHYLKNQKHQLELIKQKEAHLSAIFEVQENERKELAKELHDGVSQLLSSVKLGISMFQYKVQTNQINEFNFNDLIKIIDQAIFEIRSISHRMMPRILQEEGLVPALQDMLEKTFKFSEIEYSFEHHGVNSRYSERIEVSLYRICQELINNIIKHSGASKVSVQLIQNEKHLILFVEDNGKGFKGENTDKGIGLLNISGRLKNLNGEFSLEPSPDSGLTAIVRIPIT